MKELLIASLAAAVWATPAAADPLWDKVEFGMSRSQVEALYPRGSKTDYQKTAIEIADVPIMGKCNAEANIRFDEAGLVKEVMIAGNPSMGGRCSNDVMTALSAKYGQPANWDGSGGSILARQGKVAVWSRPDGVAMRFKKFESGIFGGGGLAKASWELTYTKVAADFGL
jgi:hypothetical protein